MKNRPIPSAIPSLIILLALSIVLFACTAAPPEETAGIPHLRKTGDATQLIVDGEPFVMLAGELHNSTASSLDYLATVWDAVTQHHLNTVLVALSWETIEPEEGVYDFTLLDGIIEQTRAHDLKLVLLWFASWKNGCTTYPPAWVKTDLDRFPRSQDENGANLDHLSVFGKESMEADARAFAAVMRRIREIDSDRHTVIAMQVENESGLLGPSRDHSPLADEAFAGDVPAELKEFLARHLPKLPDEFKPIWGENSCEIEGSWADVFGEHADEVFMTWYNARYIDTVAAAGKAEYPLPMFVNAWQDGGGYTQPGQYPSGGPIAKMIPVWQAAAPNIDVCAPDIYLPDFKGICDKYVAMGNPLLIPESSANAANVFYAIAEHDALGYAPFGIDGGRVAPDSPFTASYQLLGQLMPYITEYHGTGRMIGLLGRQGETRETDLGDYRLVIDFQGERDSNLPGYGLIIAMNDGSYLAVGKGYTVHFLSRDESKPRTGILTAHEMVYENGGWKERRWLNGDDTSFPPSEVHAGLRMIRNLPVVQKVTLYAHE